MQYYTHCTSEYYDLRHKLNESPEWILLNSKIEFLNGELQLMTNKSLERTFCIAVKFGVLAIKINGVIKK